MHVSTAVAPSVVEYLPHSQSSQTDASSLLIVAYLPAGQLKQGPVPAVALYLPASHLSHPPLMSSGVYPASQSRGSTDVGVDKNAVVLGDKKGAGVVAGKLVGALLVEAE